MCTDLSYSGPASAHLPHCVLHTLCHGHSAVCHLWGRVAVSPRLSGRAKLTTEEWGTELKRGREEWMMSVALGALQEASYSFGPWLCDCRREWHSAKPRGLQSQTSRERISKHSSYSVLEGEASQGLGSAFSGNAQPLPRCVKSRALQMAQPAWVCVQRLLRPHTTTGFQFRTSCGVSEPELEGEEQQEFAPS